MTIFMLVISPFVALFGVVLAANAALSPGAEGSRMVGLFLFLLGLLWFVTALVQLVLAWG